MTHLRAISVRNYNAPVHFQEVDNIAHNTSENLSGLLRGPGWGLQSVAAEGVDCGLSHTETSHRTVLTLCTISRSTRGVCKVPKGDIDIG